MVKIYDVLEESAHAINEVYSLELAIPGEEQVRAEVRRWVPTQSVILNLLLGDEDYGFALGRIYELFGDFGEGKSTIAQVLMNAVQKAGGISVLLDTESAWDRNRAVRSGHNPRQHLAVDIDTCEMGFSVIKSLLTKFETTFGGKVPIIFVWDTIAASPTENELKEDEYASGMMYKPRLIRAKLRTLAPQLAKNDASVVFVNQTIESNKPNYTGVKLTSGGGGIKFWSSQRIQVRQVGKYGAFGSKEKNKGLLSEVKIVKNRFHRPFKCADIALDFEECIDPVREVVNYLIDNTSVYNASGAYKKIVGFQEKDISFYERDARKVILETPGLWDWLVERTKAHWLGLEG